MTRRRLEFGRYGEDLALQKLKDMGYKSVVRNYRCKLGEVDLIARDGPTLVFIEIKTRLNKSLAYAKEAVDQRKMRQISKAALYYMKDHDCMETPSRFDVVAVHVEGAEAHIEVIKDAFDLAYS